MELLLVYLQAQFELLLMLAPNKRLGFIAFEKATKAKVQRKPIKIKSNHRNQSVVSILLTASTEE